MVTQLSLLLVLNIFFVILVAYFVNRMLRAASKFNRNPGDNDVQNKQKFIILYGIVSLAGIALVAVLLNAFLA